MSKILNLNLQDFVKGAFVAVISAILAYAYTIINSGSLNLDLKVVGTTALSAFIAYLIKALGTDQQGTLIGFANKKK